MWFQISAVFEESQEAVCSDGKYLSDSIPLPSNAPTGILDPGHSGLHETGTRPRSGHSMSEPRSPDERGQPPCAVASGPLRAQPGKVHHGHSLQKRECRRSTWAAPGWVSNVHFCPSNHNPNVICSHRKGCIHCMPAFQLFWNSWGKMLSRNVPEFQSCPENSTFFKNLAWKVKKPAYFMHATKNLLHLSQG